jgi:hypothetical protein
MQPDGRGHEQRQVEGRTTTPHAQLCYQNCPGSREWDQGDENIGIILLRSDTLFLRGQSAIRRAIIFANLLPPTVEEGEDRKALCYV